MRPEFITTRSLRVNYVQLVFLSRANVPPITGVASDRRPFKNLREIEIPIPPQFILESNKTILRLIISDGLTTQRRFFTPQ
jgi:hypothetical protein